MNRRLVSVWRRRRGFILIEVMAAVLILGMVLCPLFVAVQTAEVAACSVREKGASLSSYGPEDMGSASLRWGVQVKSVRWSVGPRLTVELCAPTADVTVGMWSDGWALGEWEVNGRQELEFGPEVWEGACSMQLVLRTREEGQPWGAPWRSVIPDEGRRSVDAAGESISVKPVPPAFEDDGLTLHVRSAGNPSILASWTESPVEWSAGGIALFLRGASPGLCELTVGGRSQSWLWEQGRGLDVYF